MALVLMACVALPVIAIAVATWRGPGLSPDSVVYASTARAFADTGQLTNFYGKALTMFPPGYPLGLGLALRAGWGLQAIVVVFNLASAAALVLLAFALARTCLGSTRIALGCACAVAVCTATVRVFSMMWTEPAFAVVAAMVLWLLARAISRERAPWWLVVVVGVLVSGSTALRYVGLTLIPVAVIGMWWATASRDVRDRVARMCLTAVISLIGPSVVAARNLSLGVPALGERSASGVSMATVMADSIRTLGNYVVPASALPDRLAFLDTLLGVCVAALVAAGMWGAWRRRDYAALLVSGFVILYWVAIWYSELAATLDPIGERFAAPVLAPMIVLVALALRDANGWLRHRDHARVPQRGARTLVRSTTVEVVAITGVIVALVAISTLQTWEFVHRAASIGINTRGRVGAPSPLAEAIGGLPAGIGVATTNPWNVYWIGGHVPLRAIPVIEGPGAEAQTVAAAASLAGLISNGQVSYLAYLRDEPTSLTPEVLAKAGIHTELVADLADGQLFRTRHQG